MAATRNKIRKLLVANRSEIAIRVFRAATELGIRTVGVYAREDRFALHRFKSDESYEIGHGLDPIAAYLSIEQIMAVAAKAGVDAIHPGYGFLSESPEFADACAEAGVIFIGPTADLLRRLGDKVEARALAIAAGVAVLPATGPVPRVTDEAAALAEGVGYPIMVKASWGGGGRGMREVREAGELAGEVDAARREARAAFGKDDVFFEKLVERARHIEVQILGDSHGNVCHLYERDCTVQRRHQKIIEAAPAVGLAEETREALYDSALRLADHAGYLNAGTVEFLFDVDTGEFYFIEVNPRIQVEHTVTEVITGVDLIAAQIRISQGATLGHADSGVPPQDEIRCNGAAIQCRITTEDPENQFIPDYGRITAYRGAAGFGVRLDGGTAFSGALITQHFDSLLEKVTTWGPTRGHAAARMDRALREFRIRGVKTNLPFLEAVIGHPDFIAGEITTQFIDETPELFHFPHRRDRATRLLSFIGEVLVNGNPEVAGRPRPNHPGPGHLPAAEVPPIDAEPDREGSRDLFHRLGPEKFTAWMREQKALLVTDTTFRDAHQSLLATRLRSYDLIASAPAYEAGLKGLFSLETWGGATFDVAMRFLKEDPWERLASLREAIPSTLFQMLLRGSNAVGYTNYADNVVRYFVRQAADAGIDLFRVFDALNWVENMRVAMDAVLSEGKLCEAAICYTGYITDPARSKYDLKYYVRMARELEAAGAHILAIKDMAGLCKPEAARMLIEALRGEISLPIHFHTHDTSGAEAASVLAAAHAGVDAADMAMDPLSGLTSQPSLGAVVEALRGTARDTGLARQPLIALSRYWERVRPHYAAFESDMRAGTSGVYETEIPGGQYTNLRQQARALGLESHWDEVLTAYATVNRLFGDIVKVTPSSKVVGDMAIFMVSHGLSEAQVLDPDFPVAFPDSVVAFFRGDLGQPHGGFPKALQKKVLRGETPITVRPGSLLGEVDIPAARREAEHKLRRAMTDRELASYLLYPQVFLDYAEHRRSYGDVSLLPTALFFYGPVSGEEFNIDIGPGQRLIVRYLATGEADGQGRRTIFFELNGQPRTVTVHDAALTPAKAARPKVKDGEAGQIGAPMPGRVVGVAVDAGQAVSRGDGLITIEAMKMETTVFAEADGTVAEIHVAPGDEVEIKDLLLEITLR
jgi:pyruvate carboxylase